MNDDVAGRNAPLQNSPWQRWQFVAALAVLILGVLGSLGSFAVLEHRRQHETAAQFERAAREHVAALAARVDSCLLIVETVESFYASSNEVEQEEFHRFAGPFLPRHPCVDMLAWVPRQDGPSADRAARPGQHFTISYVEPYREDQALLGMDLATMPTVLAAINRACDGGKTVLTGKVAVTRPEGGQPEFLIVAPVYRNGAAITTVAQRRENLQGFVLAAICSRRLVEVGLSGLSPIGVDMRIVDQSGTQRDQLLYVSRLRAETPNGAVTPKIAVADSGLTYNTQLDLPGRRWEILCTPAPEFLAAQASWEPEIVLACGLSLTILLAILLGMMAIHNDGTERLAAQLARTNRELRTEIGDRKRAEEASHREAAKLSAMIAGMEEGVVFADANNVIVEINDYLCRFVNKPRETILGRRIEHFHQGGAGTGPAPDPALSQPDRLRAVGRSAAAGRRRSHPADANPSTAPAGTTARNLPSSFRTRQRRTRRIWRSGAAARSRRRGSPRRPKRPRRRPASASLTQPACRLPKPWCSPPTKRSTRPRAPAATRFVPACLSQPDKAPAKNVLLVPKLQLGHARAIGCQEGTLYLANRGRIGQTGWARRTSPPDSYEGILP